MFIGLDLIILQEKWIKIDLTRQSLDDKK